MKTSNANGFGVPCDLYSSHARTLRARSGIFSPASNELPVTVGKNGVWLLAGPPGSRKSGLALQLALECGLRGSRTLFLLSEESPPRVRQRAHQLLGGVKAGAARDAVNRVALESAPSDLLSLPRHVERLVLQPGSPHRGVELVVLDSIQGGAVSGGADAAACRAAVDAARKLATAGIASLLVGHVTKANAIRGPRALEHAVDVVLLLDRRGGRRTLTIPKNRFGPAMLRPALLTIDPVTTRLVRAPHAVTQIAAAAAFVPGFGLVELQAAASLPAAGSRGRLLVCRGLPRSEVLHAIGCLSQVSGFDAMLPELSLSIACRWSGRAPTSREAHAQAAVLHLPLCLVIAGACLGRGVSGQDAAVGEADLAGLLRALPPEALEDLAAALQAGELRGMRLLCAGSDTAHLPWDRGCRFVRLESIEQAVRRLWPDLGALTWNC